MEQSKALSISWKVYAVFLIVGIVITTINIVNPMDIYVNEPFEIYTEDSWSTFAAEQPKQAGLYEHFNRSAAGGAFSTVLLGLFITLTAYRKGEKWAWIALVAGLVAFNAIQMVVSYMMTGGVLHNVLWMCPGLVILLLPMKDFLSQKATIETKV
jgi:hypothetical protein